LRSKFAKVGGGEQMSDDLPELRSIKHPRHPGISSGVCEAYSEAAEVCLARHHNPSHTDFSIECCGDIKKRGLTWMQPDGTAQRAWNNRDDATRDGAYIVSLAVVEKELGLFALSRAETRTGADYYVGMPGAADLEEAFRLEVSGVDHGDATVIRRRHREKEVQVLQGDSCLPAYASVVGFQKAIVLISLVEGT
jgi:hypothetical protein